jgi:hypothetical protein
MVSMKRKNLKRNMKKNQTKEVMRVMAMKKRNLVVKEVVLMVVKKEDPCVRLVRQERVERERKEVKVDVIDVVENINIIII